MTGADGGAGPDDRPARRWDVALSFAGAQRDYVGRVAGALTAQGVRCFYDADEQIDLWGKYLAEELPAIYGEQAAAVVVFGSAEYAARDWTRLERRAALNRAVRERREYVLPARFDDTPLPGLLSDMVTIDLRTRTPHQFAAMIAAKLAALGITGPGDAAVVRDPAQDAEAACPAGAVRVGEADPRRLGVHAAISVPGMPDEGLPEYVARDVDGRVAAKVEGSPRGQAVGNVGGGSLVVGPGALLTNSVIQLGGGESRGAESIRLAARGPGDVLVVGDVPQEPAAFQPRPELLGVLEEESGPRVSVVFAVTGIRGVGKTQVAAAYARRRIGDGWRLVAWIDAEDEAEVLAGLAQVAAAVGVGAAGEDARVLAAGVRHWLEADGAQRLMVFDNAADLDGLRPFLPAGGAAQVVITSNRRVATGLGMAVPVDVFSEEEALAFLAERTGIDDDEKARELSGDLGFLPLGLAQAAASIAAQHLGYDTYLARLRTLPVAQYLERVEGDAYPYRLAEAIMLSLRGVEEADPSGWCAEVMGLISVLAETGISRRLLHATTGDAPCGAAGIDAVAGRLADASLVGFSLDDAVVAHRLVMRVVRERLAAEGRLAAVAAEAVRVLTGLADSVTEAWRDPAGVRELAAQVIALTGHVRGHLDDLSGEVTAGLRQLRLRSVYLLNGLGDSTGQAILAAEPLAAECEEALGTDHPDTQAAHTNLAYAYNMAGRAAEAIPLLEEVLAACERVLGADHPYPQTLALRNNLADAYREAGRTADAIPLLEQALGACERVMGTDHLNTLALRNNLALAYREAGRTAEAIPLLEQTVADCERVLGADHPNALAAHTNLGDAYWEAGRAAEAISIYNRTLGACERVLGADHPQTLALRNNLTDAYRAAGQTPGTIPLLEQAVTDCERVLGTDHPQTMAAHTNLAHAYNAAGQIAEATSLFERTLADCERVLGADHPQTLALRNNLALAYRKAGRAAKATSLFERTLADRERVLGTDHPDTLRSRNNVAAAYEEAGRAAKAISIYKRTLADFERVLGTDHPSTQAVRDNLTALMARNAENHEG